MKKIYTFATGFLLLICSAKAQITFQPATSYYGAGTNTSDLASGDFNGDGFKDIVISNVFGSTHGTFLGSSIGTFTNSFNSAAISYQPYNIAVADFDNNTKLDVAFTDNYNTARTAGGTGIGTFTVIPTSAFATGANLFDMIAADFNNDGRPDLATANNNGANITVALCSITGTFGVSTNFAVGSFPYSLTSGDFNNDGNKDIAVAKGTPITGSVSVLFGNGAGSFGAPVDYIAGFKPRSVKAADFNGDGNLDLAIANYDSNNISILLGSTTGTFATAVNYNVISNPTSLVCEDIDGDTKIDLAVTNSNIVSVLKGNGLGTFIGGVNFTIPGGNALRLIAGNFNNDTKIDLAVSQYNGMAVFLNTSVCTASISVIGGTICSGQSFTIIPSGASTYTYSAGSAIVTPTTSSNYTITGTTSGGCVGSVNCYVTVATSPTINAVNSSTNNLCTGSSANLYLGSWSGPTLTTYTWSTGSNASNITVSPTITSTYSVSVTNTLGCTSNQFAVTQVVSNCMNVGIKVIDTNNALSIYPNPANEILNIELSSIDASSVSIINALGEVVLINKQEIQHTTFNIKHLNSGIYFIKVESKQGTLIKKFIKE